MIIIFGIICGIIFDDLRKKVAWIMNKKERIFKQLFDYHVGTPQGDLTDFVKFVSKSSNHFYITLLLASASNDNLGFHYEEILSTNLHIRASRTTVHSILTEGTEKKFFTKHINPKDNRKQNYKLSPEQKIEAENWLDNHPIRDYSK